MLQKIRKNTLENLEKYSPKSGSHSQDHFSQLLPHCMDWVKIVKLLREPNRNEASQPYETFCTLSLHQNTPLGPKTPTTPTQEPPQKWNSWFCPVLDPCTEMASGNSCVFPTMQVDWMSHMHWFQSWPPGWVTNIATFPWNAQLALSVSSELTSLSARVTSVEFAKGKLVTTGPIDRTPGTSGSDKN